MTPCKKKVVIIGAGFSVDAGIPPQEKILDEIYKIDITKEHGLVDTRLPKSLQIVKDVFIPFLYGLNTKNRAKIQLEDVYTILDLNILKQKNIGIFDTASLLKIRASLDDCVSYVINKSISDKDLKKYNNKLKKLIKNRSVTFVSTNWDFLLEKTLRYMGYRINYSIELEDYDQVKPSKDGITVLKPHGSLSWKLCPICGTIYSSLDSNIYKCNYCSNLYSKHKDIISILSDHGMDIKESILPVIVSPTFLKNNNNPQLNMIFQNIVKELNTAYEICFIGYSLPISDHDIRELLLKSKSINSPSKIEIITKPSNQKEKDGIRKNYLSIYDGVDTKLVFKDNGF